MIEQPTLEPRRGARETGGGEDQERRRRQHRQDDADRPDRDEEPAEGEQDSPERTTGQ